jgi:hypothetical protein
MRTCAWREKNELKKATPTECANIQQPVDGVNGSVRAMVELTLVSFVPAPVLE